MIIIIIEQVKDITYVEITLTSKLKWINMYLHSQAKHLKYLVSCGGTLIHICPRSVRETAYKTFAQPTLQYGSAAWDPCYEKDIQKLERVQIKAARFCVGNYNPYASVIEMLQGLNWETL